MDGNTLIALLIGLTLAVAAIGWLFYCWYRRRVRVGVLVSEAHARMNQDRDQADWDPERGDYSPRRHIPRFSNAAWIRPKRVQPRRRQHSEYIVLRRLSPSPDRHQHGDARGKQWDGEHSNVKTTPKRRRQNQNQQQNQQSQGQSKRNKKKQRHQQRQQQQQPRTKKKKQQQRQNSPQASPAPVQQGEATWEDTSWQAEQKNTTDAKGNKPDGQQAYQNGGWSSADTHWNTNKNNQSGQQQDQPVDQGQESKGW
ncbi:hypothetical protein NUU61_008478 [Penicillium alfredii]|uniref:Uncharacterized protein n=1 Tax=Penicillium alfredii TaxID=1506179 RepID=A0A9W9ELF6_9EURO|nr:uncharacterized protein NUU61_008478 [Penicillium alfredii]KAJ5083899.1 hypothetical protein NUU61_008478 [Penicillium alfredii]